MELPASLMSRQGMGLPLSKEPTIQLTANRAIAIKEMVVVAWAMTFVRADIGNLDRHPS